MDHVKMHLAYASLPFSISGNEGPFLRLLLIEKTSRKTCPVSLEAPKLSGFGYPLVGDFQLLIPLVASFSHQRSWASLFRVLLQLSDRYGFSTLPLRSCAFLQNLSASYRRFNGLLPLQLAVPHLLLPNGLGQDGTMNTLLSFWTF